MQICRLVLSREQRKQHRKVKSVRIKSNQLKKIITVPETAAVLLLVVGKGRGRHDSNLNGDLQRSILNFAFNSNAEANPRGSKPNKHRYRSINTVKSANLSVQVNVRLCQRFRVYVYLLSVAGSEGDVETREGQVWQFSGVGPRRQYRAWHAGVVSTFAVKWT
jgi:hypothetical protein